MATYKLIFQSTVGSGGAANIDFTSIPTDGTYTDLLLKLSARSTRNDFATNDVLVSFNNSSANQTQINLRGYPNGPISQSMTSIMLGNMPSATNTGSTFANSEMYIANYSNSSNKSVNINGVSESNGGGTYDWWLNSGANLWSITSAINRITLTPEGGWSFAQYTTAYLYGIKNS